MAFGKINETLVVQGTQTPQDTVSLGRKVLKVTVRALPTSINNVLVGWNQPASLANILEPGDSVTYFYDGVLLDNNSLYISFDTTGGVNGGQALISVINQSDENC